MILSLEMNKAEQLQKKHIIQEIHRTVYVHKKFMTINKREIVSTFPQTPYVRDTRTYVMSKYHSIYLGVSDFLLQ